MASTFLTSGTTPLPQDTKRTLWVKLLGKQQGSTGAASNNPSPTDTINQIKAKLIKAGF